MVRACFWCAHGGVGSSPICSLAVFGLSLGWRHASSTPAPAHRHYRIAAPSHPRISLGIHLMYHYLLARVTLLLFFACLVSLGGIGWGGPAWAWQIRNSEKDWVNSYCIQSLHRCPILRILFLFGLLHHEDAAPNSPPCTG